MTQRNMTIPFDASPFNTLQNWFREAEASEPNDSTAACLSTIGLDGLPNSRMVLVRHITARSFTFFTNLGSQKSQELRANPSAALCFHWKSLRRQIRIRGTTEETTEDQADSYYHARPRENQIGAWASKQSEPLADRSILLERFEHYKNEFEEKTPPPALILRPPFWSGFCLVPRSIELWQEGEGRLHHRLLYTVTKDGWDSTLLYP